MIPALLCSAMIFDLNKIDFYRLVLIQSNLRGLYVKLRHFSVSSFHCLPSFVECLSRLFNKNYSLHLFLRKHVPSFCFCFFGTEEKRAKPK